MVDTVNILLRMTAATSVAPSRRTAADPALQVMLLCIALVPPTVLALALDPRTLEGDPLWAKPLKFQLSLALHWATVWLALRLAGVACAAGSQARRLLQVGAACSAVEVIYIALQAARGRGSHFNTATAWEGFMYYGVMGPAAVGIVATTAWLGWLLLRSPAGPSRWRLAGGLGLLLGGLSTLLVTAPLAAGFGPAANVIAPGLPVLGWSTSAGDLRVPHFFATHLPQALLAVGWLAQGWKTAQAQRVLILAGAGGLLLVALTLVQALAGLPFLPREAGG